MALATLSLPHGNADSERILKYVSHNLNERSAMKSLTLNGLLVTFGLMSNGWASSTFPFSDSLAELCLSARSRYQERLKRQKEEEELKEMEYKNEHMLQERLLTKLRWKT